MRSMLCWQAGQRYKQNICLHSLPWYTQTEEVILHAMHGATVMLFAPHPHLLASNLRTMAVENKCITVQTAMMTVTDLVVAFGDEVLPQMDLGGAARPASSLLSQLLLKVGVTFSHTELSTPRDLLMSACT